MWLIVGLGNPGKEYENHRHNIGFMVADRIASDFSFPSPKKKFASEYSEGRIGGEKALLLKPQTFMNNSGRAVAEAANFYKIPAERIVAFHDELDLPPGKIRWKKGGGAGGHNGLKSMDDWLTTQDYHRIRIGIGHPGDKDAVSGYVLSNFAKADQDWIPKLVESLSKHLPTLLQEDFSGYMSKIVLDTQPQRPNKPKEPKEQDKKEVSSNGI